MASPENMKQMTPETTETVISSTEITETPVVLSEEEAKQMVEDFLNNPETTNTLYNLQSIEEKYRANALPENVKNIYVKAKEHAVNQLKNDNNFQLAMKQVWINLDGFTLPEIWEERAKVLAGETVRDPATKQQLKIAKDVIINKYSSLDPMQQEALKEGLKVFKDSISKISTELWLNW